MTISSPILKKIILVFTIFCVQTYCSILLAQIINGPGIDTLYQKSFNSPAWPTEFARYNLDGISTGLPFGSEGWAIHNYYNADFPYCIMIPYIFAPPVRFNRWFVLPPIALGNDSYEICWKSRGGSGQLERNAGIKVYACGNCPNISAGNIENVFPSPLFELSNEIGQNLPDPFIFQDHKVSLDGFRNKVVRIAFQNTDSAQSSIAFKEFLIRSKPLHNMGIVAIKAPKLPCHLKASEKVGVVIKNEGGLPVTGFTVSLYSNSTLIQAQTYSPNLGFDSKDTVFFQVDMSTPGQYVFQAKVDYNLDTVGYNDTLSLHYIHHPPANLTVQGWKEDFTRLDSNMVRIVDKNGDHNTWEWTNSEGNSGIYGEKVVDELWYPFRVSFPNTIGNEWFIGGCLALLKDSLYTLSIDWSNTSYGNGRRIEVWLGNEADPDSLNRKIGDYQSSSGVLTNEASGFSVPVSGTYFFGVQSKEYTYSHPFTRIKRIGFTQQRRFDLAVTGIFQPGDSSYACPGSGQAVKLKVHNLGKQAFPFPTFEIEAIGPGGSQIFQYTSPEILASGKRYVLSIPANFDFSVPGKYQIIAVHATGFDQEKSNDTTTSVFKTYAPVPKTHIANLSSAGVSYSFPEGWWVEPDNTYSLYGLQHGFAGSGGIKQDMYAVSPQYTGLGSSSHFVVDVWFEGASGTNNFLQTGDTIEFLVAKNCGPFQSLKKFLPGVQRPTGFVPVYIDLASLNVLPSDQVAIQLKATHTANFVGLDYKIHFDKVRVEQVASFDAQVRKPVWYPYSQVTSRHKVSFIPSFQVYNGGASTLNPVNNTCSISPAGYQETINTNVSVNVVASQNIGFPSFIPLTPDTFLLRYQTKTVSFQTDGIPENNQDSTWFALADSTLARDYGPSIKRLGFTGTSSRGMMGQTFVLQTADTLTGIHVFLDTLSSLIRLRPVLYACNPTTGIPNNFPLDSNFALTNIPQTNQRKWNYISLRRPADQNRGVALPAGKYWFGLIQKQGYMSLGYNPITAEKRTVYKRNSAANGNAWTLVDTVGQVLLRAHFGKPVTVGVSDLLTVKPSGLKLRPNPADQWLMVETVEPVFGEKALIFNSLGVKVKEFPFSGTFGKLDVGNLPPGLYRIRVGRASGGFLK